MQWLSDEAESVSNNLQDFARSFRGISMTVTPLGRASERVLDTC